MLDINDLKMVAEAISVCGSKVQDAWNRIFKEIEEAQKTPANRPKCLCDDCSVGCLIYAGEVTQCSGYKSWNLA